jgi:F-type H+-transporting ATPase subunit b
MELIQPGAGLIFWMIIAFGTAWFILGKFAWKPIMKGLKSREESIRTALDAAEEARKEVAEVKADHEKLLKEAKIERDKILAEARKIRDKMIEDARDKANVEANRIVENATERIENEKRAALTDLKNEVAKLSIEIAEKVLESELSDKGRHEQLIRRMVNDIKSN